jgi:nucleotide-binding universal stress UspA family protein
MKILLAYDGSPFSEAAVREVGRRPWPERTEIRLFTVEPVLSETLPEGPATAFDEIVQRQHADMLRRLHDAAAALKQASPALVVTPILKRGRPKEAILDEADRWGADLIVLGSHGYGAFRRLFLGSVSLAVATHAACSVEIVRVPASSDAEAASPANS